MTLTDLVATNAIVPALKVNNKKQAIQELAARAAELTGQNERAILEILLQREKLGSTAVGNGVAIPHGKLPKLGRLFGLFARLERPVDFEALDGQPVDLIRRAKQDGLPVTCATSINHLTLNDADIGEYRTFLKVSPPLRAEADRRALVEALAEGVIDAIVSDHDPQDVETKRQPFAEAADGAIGLETMLPAALRLVHGEDIGLPGLLRALTRGPAACFGLPGGGLARGDPADLVVFDPDEPWVVDPAALRSLCKNTPYDEARLQGRVLATLVGGEVVHAVAGRLPGL